MDDWISFPKPHVATSQSLHLTHVSHSLFKWAYSHSDCVLVLVGELADVAHSLFNSSIGESLRTLQKRCKKADKATSESIRQKKENEEPIKKHLTSQMTRSGVCLWCSCWTKLISPIFRDHVFTVNFSWGLFNFSWKFSLLSHFQSFFHYSFSIRTLLQLHFLNTMIAFSFNT